jgi:hypothetical protein
MNTRKKYAWISPVLFTVGVVTLMITGGIMGSASGATLCVEPNGAGGCYTKIQTAVNAAAEGDVINVGPENYVEGTTLNVQKSLEIVGTAGPEKTTITGSTDGITVGSNRTVTIRGFMISGTNDGVYVNGGAILTLKNNIIIGNSGRGVYCNANAVTCIISNNTVLSSGLDGIYSDNSVGPVETVTLYNNIILDSVNLNNDVENCFYNTITGTILNTTCTNTQTADPLFITGHYCAVQSSSPTINAGTISPMDNDPDDTRNNQGCAGGPLAAAFWPYPSGGPVITDLTVSPASVPQGGTVTIQATGEVR